MKPGELTKGKYVDFAKLSQDFAKASMERFDPNKAKLRSAFESGSSFIKKLKFEANKSYAVLMPLELCLPFNPETLDEETFNKENPLPLGGSPTTAALALKRLAKENDAFAEKLSSVMGVSISSLNLDNDYIADEKEIRTWHRLARIQYLTGTVQHLNTDKSKFKFGRNCGCTPIMDEAGNITGTEGIGYSLCEMEAALISIKIQMINDSYEAGGENAGRPLTERDSAIKALWNDRLIGKPFNLSFACCIVFETDNIGNLTVKTVSDWNKDKKLKPLMKYMKVTNDKISIFESVLSERADTAMDFIEVRIQTPEMGDNNRLDYQKINYSTASRDNSIFRMHEDNEDTPVHDLRNFKEEYTSYRDNEKTWNDDILRRSIYEFRTITDDALLSEMQESVKVYEDAMKSNEIIQSYGEIISQINNNLMDEALTSIISGDDNGKTVDIDIVNSAPVHDELHDPSEGDSLSEIDDILNGISGVGDINDISLN